MYKRSSVPATDCAVIYFYYSARGAWWSADAFGATTPVFIEGDNEWTEEMTRSALRWNSAELSTSSEMTYIVSGGALNSTHSPVVGQLGHIQWRIQKFWREWGGNLSQMRIMNYTHV